MKITPQFLEAINGTLVVIFGGLAFFFARYIIIEFMNKELSWRQARRNRAAAIAMLMILVGEGLIRGNVWAWRHFELPVETPFVVLGVTAGVCFSIIGGICGLRHFAPTSWGRWPWIGIPTAGVIFGVLMAMD